MTGFSKHRGIVAPIAFKNVDTDQIIPARFLTGSRSDGFSQYLFFDLRHDDSGAPRDGFVLDEAKYRTASILVSDENFGCGSSREQAVWALIDAGYKVVIAPSFGDIFFINAMKNGLLPIVVPPEHIAALLRNGSNLVQELEVDLINQTVTGEQFDGFSFEIDPYWRSHLVEGTTELGLTLAQIGEIEAFQSGHRKMLSWAFCRPGQESNANADTVANDA